MVGQFSEFTHFPEIPRPDELYALRVVIYFNKIRTNCTREKAIGLQGLIPISYISPNASCKDKEVGVVSQRVAFPDHQASMIATYNELNGQVVRMVEDRTTKRVFNVHPTGIRGKGRSNIKWIGGLKKYLLVLRTKCWRNLAERRMAWKILLEKAKA
ncbi:hypothetical protein TNCV_2708851 [Trichonephila clavipes]|nr:hypothetical protein TNCV_2708851 [Trichonephila clavipes]